MTSNLVSVIICVKNAEDTIEKCLVSALKNNPKEVTIVYAKSNDRTLEICKKFPVNILNDEGIGLGNARNLALKQTTSKFIYYIGPDDILEKNSIENLVNYIKKVDWIGVSPLVEVIKSNKTYVGKCLNITRKAKNYEGEKKVIGTPWMYHTSILKEYMYDSNLTYSDDSDINHRMRENGLKVGVSNVLCFTEGDKDIKTVFSRWKMYGRSDAEYYNKYLKNSNLRLKINSILSPLKKEFIIVIASLRISLINKIYILPYLLILVLSRYYGWITSKKSKK